MTYKKRKATMWAVALLAVTMVAAPKQEPVTSGDMAFYRNLATFNALVRELEQNYVDSIRADEAFDMAIMAMLSTVDPYTEYYNSDDRESLSTMTTGEYGGIGSYIMERDGWTYISEPYVNSPARKAGLRAGDRLLRIDTVDLKGMKSGEVTKLLKGTPGTDVTVQVQRPYAGADSILDITVHREKLAMPSVPWYGRIGDGSVGYITLTSFMDKSPKEVREALDSLGKGEAMKGLVLDLRGNGGGLLESAVDILGNFLPKGTEVLRTKGKTAASQKIYKTTHKPVYPDLPVVVLIDGGSASASEITAGAMQDLDRGVLVGSRSYGKGLVQATRPLPYDGLLKVTTAKYYIPSGRLIQALDYSRRNEDGTVARTPDSLTNVYHTRAGREVRDGGGLVPDVAVDWGKVDRLTYNLVRDHHLFDYAVKYAAEHPEIASPKEFVVTDEMYEDFKQSIDPQKLKYDKVCEDMMKQLRETVEAEGYMNDETREAIDALAALLNHDLNHDLDIHRKDIERYLAGELMLKYWYGPGKIEQDLRNDPGVAKALEILSDPAEYKRLLSKP